MLAANFFQHQAGEFPFKGGSAQALGLTFRESRSYTSDGHPPEVLLRYKKASVQNRTAALTPSCEP